MNGAEQEMTPVEKLEAFIEKRHSPMDEKGGLAMAEDGDHRLRHRLRRILEGEESAQSMLIDMVFEAEDRIRWLSRSRDEQSIAIRELRDLIEGLHTLVIEPSDEPDADG